MNDTEPSTTCTTPSDFIPLQKEAEDDDISNKQKKKKIHAIEELLQTERDYVKDLTYLVQVHSNKHNLHIHNIQHFSFPRFV